MRILSVGEILWDVFDDEERLGGAPFNFAAHARRLGHDVRFVSAVGDDERGRRALGRVEALGLSSEFILRGAERPTGTVTVRLDASGQPEFTIHRPAAYDSLPIDEALPRKLAAFSPEWIYFGTLHQMERAPRALIARLLEVCPSARRFYDVNLRPESYTPELVRELMGQAHVVKLNDAEAATLAPGAGVEEFCRTASRDFGWDAVAVTRGERGCAILAGGVYAEVPGYRVQVADTVGAGDAFAAALLHGLERRWDAMRIGDFANRVGALVASRSGGIPPWTLEECLALSAARLP